MNQNAQTNNDNLWPIFGYYPYQQITHDKSQQNTNQKFWVKNDTQNIEENYQLKGNLLSTSQKSKTVKNKIYFLQGLVLFYKKSESDKNIKGYIKLGPHVQLERVQFQDKGTTYFGINFQKDWCIKQLLYSEDTVFINQIYNQIKGYCILSDFDLQYSWKKELGAGSFSTAFLVKRNIDNKKFAAKVYYKKKFLGAKNPKYFVQMIKNEYAVLKKIKHSNIVNVYELYQEEDRIIFLLDYVKGGELSDHFQEIGKFEEQQAAFVIKQVAEALEAVHKQEIVHRDLKLENILINDLSAMQVKLIDFGFSEKINRKQLVAKSGTPGFLPPEMFDLKPFTEKGDVFSLGVILYTLLIGKKPFKDTTYSKTLANNKMCQVNYDQTGFLEYSNECISCLQKMIEINPLKRYNVPELLNDPWIQSVIEPEVEQVNESAYISEKTQKSMTRKTGESEVTKLKHASIRSQQTYKVQGKSNITIFNNKQIRSEEEDDDDDDDDSEPQQDVSEFPTQYYNINSEFQSKVKPCISTKKSQSTYSKQKSRYSKTSDKKSQQQTNYFDDIDECENVSDNISYEDNMLHISKINEFKADVTLVKRNQSISTNNYTNNQTWYTNNGATTENGGQLQCNNNKRSFNTIQNSSQNEKTSTRNDDVSSRQSFNSNVFSDILSEDNIKSINIRTQHTQQNQFCPKFINQIK